jgi:RNA polymerase sigma-70 factor, ECF subfamily
MVSMVDGPRQTRYSSLSLQDVVGLCAGPCDNEAWEEFVLRVRKPIAAVIARTASSWGNTCPSLVEDLVQVTYLKLWEKGCSMLQVFAQAHPDALLGYLIKMATNATHDHFKHRYSQTSGGEAPHVSTADVDAAAGSEIEGTLQRAEYDILVNEIDEMLANGLSGPDEQRDRMIFWLYFRQGMTTSEIASVPTVGLGAKGVGSVIERLKHLVRDQIVGSKSNSDIEEKAKASENSYSMLGE